MQFGLEEDPPPAGSATSEIERPLQQANQPARSESVTRSWPWRRGQLAINDLRDEMLRHRHQIFEVAGLRAEAPCREDSTKVHQDDDGIVLRGRSSWENYEYSDYRDTTKSVDRTFR